MLKISHISKTFNPGTVNEKKAITDLSLELKKGDFATIIGSNGAGKSTLLNCLANILEPYSGKILVNGASIHDMSLKKAAQLIGYVPQNMLRYMTIQ